MIRTCAACEATFSNTLIFLNHLEKCKQLKQLVSDITIKAYLKNVRKEVHKGSIIKKNLDHYKAAKKAGINLYLQEFEDMINSEEKRSLLK